MDFFGFPVESGEKQAVRRPLPLDSALLYSIAQSPGSGKQGIAGNAGRVPSGQGRRRPSLKDTGFCISIVGFSPAAEGFFCQMQAASPGRSGLPAFFSKKGLPFSSEGAIILFAVNKHP
jgi:hypothetical protein